MIFKHCKRPDFLFCDGKKPTQNDKADLLN